MKGYRIGPTVIDNFLAFKHAEFDFSLPGLTVVEGRIRNIPGCDSNGSGKSALLEAPVWSITGRTIRERCKGDDVVRNGSTGGARVDTTVYGEKTIRTVRHRAHSMHGNKVFLYVDGKDVTRGTNIETDRAIEEELGLDFTTFLNTVAFGARAEVKSFFFAADADRKKIMDKLLGLEVFERAQTIARARFRNCTAELDPLMSREINLGFAIKEQEEALAALQDQPLVDEVQLRDAQIAVKSLTRKAEMADEKLSESKLALDELEETHREKYRIHETALTAFHRTRQRAMEEVATLKATARSCVESADKDLARARKLEALKKGEPCPVCTNPVQKGPLQVAINELHTAEEAAREKAKEHRAAASKLEDEANSIKAPKPPSDEGLRQPREKYNEARDRVVGLRAQLKAAIERLDEMTSMSEGLNKRIKQVRAKTQELQEELAENNSKQSVLREQLTKFEFWTNAFGNGGVKSFVIESELPRINQLATEFARRLLGEGAFVRLSATRKLKTQDVEKEEMNVEAGIPGCSQNYAGASKGQRHRLDLSMILAFRAVVAARSACPFDQLFADELFDGVDETGVDCVVEILREVSATCPVILVTHDARLQSVGDRRVLVKHNGQRAVLKSK